MRGVAEPCSEGGDSQAESRPPPPCGGTPPGGERAQPERPGSRGLPHAVSAGASISRTRSSSSARPVQFGGAEATPSRRRSDRADLRRLHQLCEQLRVRRRPSQQPASRARSQLAHAGAHAAHATRESSGRAGSRLRPSAVCGGPGTPGASGFRGTGAGHAADVAMPAATESLPGEQRPVVRGGRAEAEGTTTGVRSREPPGRPQVGQRRWCSSYSCTAGQGCWMVLGGGSEDGCDAVVAGQAGTSEGTSRRIPPTTRTDVPGQSCSEQPRGGQGLVAEQPRGGQELVATRAGPSTNGGSESCGSGRAGSHGSCARPRHR